MRRLSLIGFLLLASGVVGCSHIGSPDGRYSPIADNAYRASTTADLSERFSDGDEQVAEWFHTEAYDRIYENARGTPSIVWHASG